MPTFLILAGLVITIILAGLVVARPGLTVARGGKVHIDDSSHIPAARFQNGRAPREQACYYLPH